MVSSADPSVGNRSLLQIRVVTQNGDPLDVFPNADDSGYDTDLDALVDPLYLNTDSKSLSSILPPDSDDLLTMFVGEDAVEKFLFLNLEWTDPTDLEEEEEGDAAEEVSKIAPRLEEERFVKQRKASAGKKGVTLDRCFETFTKPERLDENNMWYCSSCKEHVRAMKTMELWKLPNVLILHLKRFEFKHALRRDKLDTLVEFPLDGLDMNVHCASRSNSTFVDDHVPAIYDCFAVVNHFGQMGFGHYTAFARQRDETGISENWALFDDSRVQNVDNPRGIVSPAAYVLFYRRRTFN
jgi:ubiquitin carboxyl-terminal hydrolase 4/11/15